MLRFPAFAILCLAASPALAQNQTTPAPAGPPPEAVAAIQQTSAALGQCIQTGMSSVPAAMTPEAGATRVLGGCATQRQAVERAARALIATLPEAGRPGAEAQLNSQMSSIEAQIAGGIRQMRAAPVGTPAPAPAQ
jgi:hypothetical protein